MATKQLGTSEYRHRGYKDKNGYIVQQYGNDADIAGMEKIWDHDVVSYTYQHQEPETIPGPICSPGPSEG